MCVSPEAAARALASLSACLSVSPLGLELPKPTGEGPEAAGHAYFAVGAVPSLICFSGLVCYIIGGVGVMSATYIP